MWCIRVAFEVLALGSFLCSVVARRSKVAIRVSMDMWSAVFGPGLSPLGGIASMTLVGEMWYEASEESVW